MDMYIENLINDYRRRAMSPDDAGGVRVGALGLLQILSELEISRAQLAELAAQEPVAWGNLDYMTRYGYCSIFENKEHVVGETKTPLFTRAAPPVPLDDLVMQIRRLVHALKKVSPDNQLATQVSDYMQQAGYWKSTDCLRGVADD